MACQSIPNIVSQNVRNLDMGIGKLGGDEISHKRKFRWLFSVSFCNDTKHVPPHFIKTASRPEVSIEETEINFLNEKTWIPGKPTWEPITVTYYDIAGDSEDNIELWSWIATVFDYTDSCRHMSTRRSEYTGVGNLVLLDGCGNAMEYWKIGDMWPTSIKFGDLDMASSDPVEIELTLRYSKVEYVNICGPQPSPCDCVSCA